MQRFLFMSLIVFFFVIPSVSCQEAKKPPLDYAQTAAQVGAYLSETSQKLRANIKDEESYKQFLQAMGEACVAGGEKLLTLAKDDDEKEKAYRLKLEGLQTLINMDRIANIKDSKNEETLDKLVSSLEKDGKYPLLVNEERFQQVIRGLGDISRDITPEKFEQIKKDMKEGSNKKPAKPIEPLLIVVQIAGSEKLLKTDPKLVEKTVQELTAFINSAESTIPDDKKKAVVEYLEGFTRRSVGSELKLYGKTLDDKDFDWLALRGQYVLVVFTASWCMPCREEIPGMLEIYKKYHDKGLEIVSVYIWDKLEDSQRIVQEFKLPWHILSDELTVKAKQQPQGQMYSIEGVPTMLLIDKDGKVIEANARGENLPKRLTEIFK